MLIFTVGLAVGLLSTVFGLGGGVLMVPALTALAGFSHIEAMATSLGTIVLVSSWNSWRYHRQGLVLWRAVVWIALGSALCASIAGFIAPLIPEKILIGLLFLVLLGLAWKTFSLGPIEAKKSETTTKRITAFSIGSFSGLIAGFTGIGGGGITTPLILVTGLAQNRTAAPTSNAIMIFTSAAGAIAYALNGSCNWPRLGLIQADYSLLLAAGAILSSFIGIRLNQLVPLKVRKTVLGCILLFVALRLLFQMAAH